MSAPSYNSDYYHYFETDHQLSNRANSFSSTKIVVLVKLKIAQTIPSDAFSKIFYDMQEIRIGFKMKLSSSL